MQAPDRLSSLDQNQLQDEGFIESQSSLSIAGTLQIIWLMDLSQRPCVWDQLLALKDLCWQQVIDIGDLIEQDLYRLLDLP